MNIKKYGKQALPRILLIISGILLLTFFAILFISGNDVRDEVAWLKTIFVITGLVGTFLFLFGIYLTTRKEFEAISKKRLEALSQQNKEASDGYGKQ
jgi:hypothetical protein